MANRKGNKSTIDDVAREAGVSTATVSRVINNNGPVAEETTKRVWDVINKLQYVPHPAARRLASQKTNTLGLVLPSIGGAFFAPMLKGIEEAAWENNYELLIFTSSRPIKANAKNFQLFGEHNVDGLILFTNTLKEKDLRKLYNKNLPVVLLHQTPPSDLDIPCVSFENKEGARMMIDHLIDVHHYKRIAFLAGPKGHEDSYWREQGYRQSLEAHGIDFDPGLVADGGFDAEVAAESVQQWLNEGKEIDAIFSGDDETASGVLSALHRNSIRTPEDMAVVGFDDVHFSRHLNPPLTTIHAPIEKAGYVGVSQLVQLIKGENPEKLVLLPTELVVRESCGCKSTFN